MQRRHLLAVMGTLGSSVIAGCSTATDSGENTTTTSSGTTTERSTTTEDQTDQDTESEQTSLSSNWSVTDGTPSKSRSTNSVSVTQNPGIEWELPTDTDAEKYWYSPAIGTSERVVVIQNEGFDPVNRTVHGIDPKEPGVEWSSELGESRFLIPELSLVDERLYMPTSTGVKILGADSGEDQTTLSTQGSCNRAIVTESYIFAGGSNAITAFERDSHSQAWSRSEFSINANFSAPFAIGNEYGLAYANGDGFDGNTAGFNISDGSIKWTTELKPSTGVSPSIEGGYGYFGDRERGLLKIELQSGDIVWETPTESVPGAVAIGRSQVFVVVDAAIVAVDKNTGEKQWSVPEVTDIDSSPIVVGDTVIAGAFTGSSLYGIAVDDGSRRWTIDLPSKLYTGLSATSGGIFPSIFNGEIVKIS